MQKHLTFSLLVFLSVPTSSWAEVPVGSGKDWKLSLGAQLRPRVVMDSGRDLQDGDLVEREYVTQRARLTLKATHDHGHTIVVQLQDVRQWGEANGPADFRAEGLDAHQAYAELALPADISLRLGRQELILDDHRLIGNLGWAQRGFTFDGLTARLKTGKLTLTGLGFVLSETDMDPDGTVAPDRAEVALMGLHGNYAMGKALSASLLAISRRNQLNIEDRHTVGLFAKGATSGVSYQLDAYLQLGKLGDEDISAWLAAARLGYSMSGGWRSGLMLWFEAISGDGKPQGAFDTLYATNHKFYGEMDFFLNIPVHTGLLGLQDIGGRLWIRDLKPVWLYIDAHQLSTMEENAAGDTALGTEVDAVVKWAYGDALTFRAVYGVMLPEDGLGALRGAPDPQTEHMFFLTTNLAL